MAHKYKAQPTEVDGIRFASKLEAKRYVQLLLLKKAGEIDRLELQPRLPCVVNGVKVCTYVADFAYFTGNARVYEDCKGFPTPVYKLKKKLVQALYPGIEIIEVR